MKRTGKFYRNNEKEVMKALGFKPTRNSGSGWVEKEDGQNECCICQLKSTDARSISVKQEDLHILEYNASVSHKTPIFAIQFLNTSEVWLLVKPEDLERVKAISQGNVDMESNEQYIKINVDNQAEQSYNESERNKRIMARKRFHSLNEKRKEEFEEKRRKERRESDREWKRNLRKKG